MITITDVLNLIKKIKSDEVKNFAKTYIKKAHDVKITTLRNTGEVGKLNWEIMSRFKVIDELNIRSFDKMNDLVSSITKNREVASKIFRVKTEKLKLAFKAGKINATEYAKQIKVNKNALRFTEKQIESDYLSAWMKNITDTNKLKSGAFKDTLKLKDQLKLAKQARTKNILIGIAITIVVVSAIAVAVKAYALLMKKLKSPCRDIDNKEDKNRCEIHSEIDALNAKMIILKEQSIKCELSEDPIACNFKIDKEIDSIKAKVDEYKTKLDDL